MKRGSKLNRLMDYYVGIPVLNIVAAFRRNRKWPNAEIRKVGLICAPALGDTLLFSAIVQDLRTHFLSFNTQLVHFCTKQNLASAELIPGIDRRVLIDLKRPVSAIKAMRAEALDVMFDFTPWQRLTAFCGLFSGAHCICGFSSPGQYRGRAYDIYAEHRSDCHEVDNFRGLLTRTGIKASAAPLVQVPPTSDESFPSHDDVVVFHPWASGNRSWLREWPEVRWIELARKITRPSTLFVITGGPADRPRSESLVAQMRKASLRAEAFISPDGFASLSHLLLKSRVVVSVNTGVMHLAAILGAPTVSLNGPTSTRRWGGIGPRVASVEPADGSGGFLHLGFEFDGQPEDTMQKICVKDVDAAVSEVTRPEILPSIQT